MKEKTIGKETGVPKHQELCDLSTGVRIAVTAIYDYVRSKHNGYSAEARAVMPGLKEPATLLEAIKDLVEERVALEETVKDLEIDLLGRAIATMASPHGPHISQADDGTWSWCLLEPLRAGYGFPTPAAAALAALAELEKEQSNG